MNGETLPVAGLTVTMRELLLLPDVRRLWLESEANRRPPLNPFSNAMSIAGPCGWKTAVPPVTVVASVGFPSGPAIRIPLWSNTRMSGVKGFGVPGACVFWNFSSSLQILGRPCPDSSTKTSNFFALPRKATAVGAFSPLAKTDTVKPEGTMMSSPLPGSKKTFSPEQSGFVTSAMTRPGRKSSNPSARVGSSQRIRAVLAGCGIDLTPCLERAISPRSWATSDSRGPRRSSRTVGGALEARHHVAREQLVRVKRLLAVRPVVGAEEHAAEAAVAERPQLLDALDDRLQRRRAVAWPPPRRSRAIRPSAWGVAEFAAPEERGDRAAEVVEPHGLHEVSGEAVHLHRRVASGKGGHRDGGDRAARLVRARAQPLEELRPRAIGQHEIADDEIGRDGFEGRPGLGDGDGGDGARAADPERGVEQLEKVRVVVDDEDAGTAQRWQSSDVEHRPRPYVRRATASSTRCST